MKQLKLIKIYRRNSLESLYQRLGINYIDQENNYQELLNKLLMM